MFIKIKKLFTEKESAIFCSVVVATNISLCNTTFLTEHEISCFIYIYICIYIRLPHPRSRDSQGQETFLAPSADKQTCNYDHHPSLSTLRSQGLSPSKMKC